MVFKTKQFFGGRGREKRGSFGFRLRLTSTKLYLQNMGTGPGLVHADLWGIGGFPRRSTTHTSTYPHLVKLKEQKRQALPHQGHFCFLSSCTHTQRRRTDLDFGNIPVLSCLDQTPLLANKRTKAAVPFRARSPEGASPPFFCGWWEYRLD